MKTGNQHRSAIKIILEVGLRLGGTIDNVNHHRAAKYVFRFAAAFDYMHNPAISADLALLRDYVSLRFCISKDIVHEAFL